MSSNNLVRFFYLILFYSLISLAHAVNINTNTNSNTQGPVITQISGLDVLTTPGMIVITNISGKDISLSDMLLKFTLDQTSIASLWGDPWLKWKPATTLFRTKLAANNFQFVNQAYLKDNIFTAGSRIVILYNPVPYNNSAKPQNVQLFSVSYTLNPVSIKSSVTSSGNVNIMTITNTSDKDINLMGSQLRFNYEGDIGQSIWGTPWVQWSVNTGKPDYVLYANSAAELPVNGNLTVVFNGAASPISNIALWAKGGSAPTTKGEFTLNFPAAPQGVTANPSVTVTGPSFPQGQTISGTWGQSYTQKNLLAGTYSFSTADIDTGSQIYMPDFSPNPATVGDSPVSVNLRYSVRQSGKLAVQVPAAPFAGAIAPMLTVSGPDFSSPAKITLSWGSTIQICPYAASSCYGLAPGKYTLTIPRVYSSTDSYVPGGFENPVEVNVSQSTVIPLTYSIVPQGLFQVNINYPDAFAKSKTRKLLQQTFAVNFADSAGHVFTKSLARGANMVSLPINETYTVTAASSGGRDAEVTPSTVTVQQQGTTSITIQYNIASPTRFSVYYGGWNGDAFDLNTRLPSNVTTVNLSFANITSALQVDTSVSGWLTNIPAPNVRMQPAYVNWTVYKYNHPDTKVLLAIGGATFSAIWTSVLTPDNADTMAKNIADVINRAYPVYKSDMSYPADLIGNVYIDGVDLDVEVGNQRLSETVSNNVVLLAKSLKKYMNPDKIITFAGFSVGADPVNQCTVPGSVHCGEDIPLLKNIGDILAWVNVMAYDAGEDYATSKYQVALTNYMQYLPKNKILLGLDIQTQWPNFSETAQQLAAKAAWQKQNGYGGAMFWGVGVDNNPPKEQQYVDAISAALK